MKKHLTQSEELTEALIDLALISLMFVGIAFLVHWMMASV